MLWSIASTVSQQSKLAVDLGSAVGKDCTSFELQQDNRLKTSRDSNSVDLIYILHHSDSQNGIQRIQRHRHLTPEKGQDGYRASLQTPHRSHRSHRLLIPRPQPNVQVLRQLNEVAEYVQKNEPGVLSYSINRSLRPSKDGEEEIIMLERCVRFLKLSFPEYLLSFQSSQLICGNPTQV